MPLEKLKEPQVVAVQIKIVRRDADGKETTQALDIPVRDPSRFKMDFFTDPYNVHLDLNIQIDPQYSIQYIIRDQRAADKNGEFAPYLDGIYSESDLRLVKSELEAQHAAEKKVLEKQIRKLLKTVRTEKS